MVAKLDSDDMLYYRHETPKGRKPVASKKPAKKTEMVKASNKKRQKKKLSEMNVVMYLRKSSEEEEKQFNSTRDQEKKCRAYIEAIELNEGIKINIVKKYEEHRSAAHAGERTEFNKMLEGVRAGYYDAILAYHPDRLSRNMLEAGILLDMIRPEKGEEVGVLQDLLFPTVSFTNDSGGRLMLAVLFSMATQYSDHLSEVVQRGVDSNFEKKGKSSGTPKWGYVRNRIKGYYEPDDNFDLIRQGWEMILNGNSQAAVLDFWKDNDVHYYTVEGSNKMSRKVVMTHKNAVSRLFKDPFYYGMLTQAGKEVDLRNIPEANFEPMVTEDEYNKVQEILDSKYQNHRKVKAEDKAFIPFQGMIICKHCGRKLYGYLNKKRRLVYYGHQNKAAKDDCERLRDKSSTNEIRGNIILDEIYKVLDSLRPTKKDYERYIKVAKGYTDDKKEEMLQEKRSKLGALSQYKREMNEEMDSYKVLVKDKRTPEAVLQSSRDKMGVLQKDIQRLENDIEELNAKIDVPEKVLLNERDFLNLLKNAPQQMRDYDFVGKDELLKIIFSNLKIDKQNKVTFLCKPEFSDLFKSSNVTSGGDMWT